MSTRPDVAFALCQLSRFLENPSFEHWKAGIRVLRYLKSTCNFDLICKNEKKTLEMSVSVTPIRLVIKTIDVNVWNDSYN